MRYERFDKAVGWLEERSGKLAGLWVALGLMMAAAVYVRPAVKTIALGVLYGRMAEDPFTVIDGNYVAFRILTPLLSYLLGFRGQLIILTNLLTATALIYLVYIYFRARAPRPGDALYAAAVMAFSLVTLTTVYYGGYTDSLTYLLLFLMWWLREKPVAFYLLFMLGMLNRECMLFLMPWFVFLRWECRKNLGFTLVEAMVGFCLALAPYYLVRHWIGSQGEVPFRAMYYLQPLLDDPFHWLRQSYSNWGLGLFTTLKLFWIVPLLAVIGLWRARERRQVVSMLLLIGCVFSQLIIAYDSSRMLTLAFPVVLIGLTYLLRTNAYDFRRWAGFLLLANFLVPQLYTAASTIETMYSLPGNILMLLLLGKVGW